MKKVLKYLLIMVLIVPLFLHATENYNSSVKRANNYINEDAFSKKNNYLIIGGNTPYKFSSGISSVDVNFKYGGLINFQEVELSKADSSSYLIPGYSYWTMTRGATGQYYVGKYRLESASEAEMNGTNMDTRVTQFVKPSVTVAGSGKYSDPWYFNTSYNVKIDSSNPSRGWFEHGGVVKTSIDVNVNPYSMFELKMITSKGYSYTGQDDCNFKASATTPNLYIIERVDRDISCTAHFGEKIYKFELECSNCTTNPYPSKLYYKYTKAWYKDDKATSTIDKITPPQRAGYTFDGYKYNSRQVISSTGQLTSNIDSLIVDNNDVQVLTPLWTPSTNTEYRVEYYLENCDGSSHNLQETAILHGTTGQTIEIPRKTYEGYITPAAQSHTINADGSLVVRYYYKRTTHNVTLNKGTGISSVSGGGNIKYGCSFTISATLESGYKWVNYTGSSTITDITKTLQMGTSDLTYTANGTGITYQIKYNKNDDGATGTMSNSSHVYNVEKALSNNEFKKTGFSFTGWSTTPNGNIIYTDKQPVSNLTTTDGEVVNLYAHYSFATPKTPTISGGGSKVYNSSATELSCSTTTSYPSTSTKYYSFGYSTVDGGTPSNWTTASTTSTYSVPKNEYIGSRWYSCRIYVTDGGQTSETVASDIAADALVKYRNAKLTFNRNGGTISSANDLYAKAGTSVVYTGEVNTTTGTIPKVSKNGTYFAGWYTESSGGSEVIKGSGTLSSSTVSGYIDSGKWTLTSDKTLYARNIACAAGTYNNTDDGYTCIDCPAGYYCTGGSNKTACPKGTYRTTTKGKSLEDCTPCARCQSTKENAQTTNTCAWDFGTGSENNTPKGYRTKLAVVENGVCHADIRDTWNESFGSAFGNYGTWDWETMSDHGYCSDNSLNTFGFHHYFTTTRKSWLSGCTNCGLTDGICNKAPLTSDRINGTTEQYGVKMYVGDNTYTFTQPISGGNTVWLDIRYGGCGANITIKNIKYNIGDSYYTLEEMVDNGYIKKIVIIGGLGFENGDVTNEVYTGGDLGQGRYPDIDMIFTLNSGYTLKGFSAYASATSKTTEQEGDIICSDGYYMRYLDSKYFDMVLK